MPTHTLLCRQQLVSNNAANGREGLGLLIKHNKCCRQRLLSNKKLQTTGNTTENKSILVCQCNILLVLMMMRVLCEG